jgi:hypothetical protein
LTEDNLFYFVLPIYLFFALVIQVFLGTMEWFPVRYLLVPIVFLIPIISILLHDLLSLVVSKVKMEKKAIVIFIILLISMVFYKKNFINMRNNLTTSSFLRITDNPTLDIKETDSFQNLVGLGNKMNSRGFDYAEYYFRIYNRSWHDQALSYMFNIKINDWSKESFAKKHDSGSLVIWEKEIELSENEFLNLFDIIYENDGYYLLDLIK